LRAQFAIGRHQIERHLEHRIAAQCAGVVAASQPAPIISKRNRVISASGWVIRSGARGSTMQHGIVHRGCGFLEMARF